ncbi:MAG: amidohydrolase, partial [Bacteroidetes bacterium]
MDKLAVTLVQCALVWEDPAANRQHIARLLPPPGSTDLVVLPEMFSSGFTMNARAVAEGMDGPTIQWMRQQAQRLDAALTGSLVIRDGEAFFNRLIWMFPDGRLEHYDKRHLFTLADEHRTYTPGRRRLLVEFKGWKILPLICYDLRFPVWSRNTKDYDLLLYVANWPIMRAQAWKQLLIARAIENLCYTAGVNRVGRDGKDIPYSGDTMLVDYAGQVQYHLCMQEGTQTLLLSKPEQEAFRQKLAFLQDRDRFTLL